ncbi:MAG: hypothetical protein O3B41_06975 [Bacteroidetes bacterium]|nr:hypothetical protein [Bacteroidota bacterium]
MLRISFLCALLCFSAASARAQITVHIDTNIPTANVFADSTWIGIASNAPFEIASHVKRISVVRAGVDSWSTQLMKVEMNLADFAGNGPELTLRAIFPEVEFQGPQPSVDVGLGTVIKKRKWLTYTAAGASLLAGAAAIHFRTKADSRFNSYLETGSPRIKREIKQLDLKSGMALGVMQIGLGVIAFRLIF